MKLIDNWQRAYRMLSVQAAALLALAAAIAEHIPQYSQYLPEGWVKWAALLVIVARVVQQPTVHKDADS